MRPLPAFLSTAPILSRCRISASRSDPSSHLSLAGVLIAAGLIIASVFLPRECCASSPDTLWTRVYGTGAAYSAVETYDGGFAAAGFLGSGDGYSDQLCLIRVDSTGHEQWRRTYPGTTAYSVIQNQDHGFLLSGYEYGPFTSPMRVIRTDSNGDTLWTRSFAVRPARSCLQLDDGSFVVVGSTYMMKLDGSGNQLWFRNLSTGAFSSIYSVARCQAGGFVLAGQIRIGFPIYAWLIRTNDSGDTLWTRRYVGAGSHFAYSVREVSSGGFIFSGRQGPDTFWAARTNADGDTLWTYSNPEAWYGFSVTELDHEQFAITGLTTSPLYDLALVRLDPNGRQLTLEQLAGLTYSGRAWEIGYSVEHTSDDGLLLAGWRDCIPTEGGYCDNGQFWLVRVAAPATSNVNEIFLPFRLGVNHPNPFQTSTRIEYEVFKRGAVQLGVFDSRGERISIFDCGVLPPGTYSRVIDLSGVKSGLYFVRLTSSGKTISRKLTVLH